MKKRSLSLILLIALLTSVSCGDHTETQTETTSSGTTDSSEVTTARLEPELPDKRWDGYEFRVLTKGVENVHWKSKDIAASEENGDTINDAVYKRNSAVTDRFGVTITDIASPNGTWNLSTPARASIMAGSDDYDMIAGSFNDAVRKLAPEGLLVDLNTVPYMDLSKPWYDQNSIDSTAIGGKTFAVTGDMLIMDKEATNAILFNKKMADEYKLGNFYDMVRDGNWTLDVFEKSARAVAADLNNDGSMDESDQYGLVTSNVEAYFLMIGFGVKTTELDKDGIPSLTLKSEKLYNAIERAVKINNDFEVAISGSKYHEDWGGILDPAFSSGRALFYVGGLNRVTLFRAMETDFGILPMPKYDEEQDGYYNMVSLSCSDAIIIPKSASDLERTGAIIEALSAEGYYTLKPAYYETVLKGKSVRDDESSEMLDIIFANRVYDLEYMYDWGGIVDPLSNSNGNVASLIASKYDAAVEAMNKTIEDYKKFD